MKVSFYVCARSDDARGGIYHLQFDATNRILTQKAQTPLQNCNFLALSPAGRAAYATCFDAQYREAVAIFVRRADQTLELRQVLSCGGTSPCYLTLSPDGNWLYCANYGGSLAEFHLAEDHLSAIPTQVIQPHGSGPRADRQEHEHVHCVEFTPDGTELCAVDLGSDAIWRYRFDAAHGICATPHAHFRATPGDGPRHLIFAPERRQAYVVNELGNSVTLIDCAAPEWHAVTTVSSIPGGNCAAATAAAIRFSPDRRFLLVTNRGYDTVATFAIAADGTLRLHQLLSSGGVAPRDGNFLPDGVTYVTANEFSDTLNFFAYDPTQGTLEDLRQSCRQYPGVLYVLPIQPTAEKQ